MTVFDDGSGARPAIFATLGNDTDAKWNSGPQTWTAIPGGFTAAGTFGARLNAIASHDDGSGPALYVGGRIDSVSGVPASNIARWRGPTLGWEPVGAGLPGEVRQLYVHNDGTQSRLVANTWAPVGSVDVVQWDGKAWSGVGDLDGSINDLTTFDDGAAPALVVSTFDRVIRWNGSAWAFIAHQGARALAGDARTLYMASPFSIWTRAVSRFLPME